MSEKNIRNRINNTRLVSTIRDVLKSSAADESIVFICSTIVAFEKSFGMKHKDLMRKMVNEAIENFGPGTTFSNDENMIPIYSLLGKYSRSLTAPEIFEKLFVNCSYRRSAAFYLEWSGKCLELGLKDKAKRILEDGLRNKAEPFKLKEALIRIAKYELLKNDVLEKATSLVDESNYSKGMDKNVTFLKPSLPPQRSARKVLFSNKPISEVDIYKNQFVSRLVDDFILPIAPSMHDVGEITQSSSTYSEDKEESENRNPLGEISETITRRRTSGILVPAVGFVLDDYDFHNKSGDELMDAKDTEAIKSEGNDSNIRNNQNINFVNLTSAIASTSSSTTSTDINGSTASLTFNNIVEPFILPASDGNDLIGSAANNLSDCEADMENSRLLTAFQRRRLKRNVMPGHGSSLKKANPQRQADVDLQSAMARLNLN